jgi:beta-glucosidase
VTVQVTNTGSRDGDEVIQVYASYSASKVPRPARQLVAFARVRLKAGERRDVSFSILASRFAYWNVDRQAFVVEPGPIKLTAGGSCADAAASGTLTIAGTP